MGNPVNKVDVWGYAERGVINWSGCLINCQSTAIEILNPQIGLIGENQVTGTAQMGYYSWNGSSYNSVTLTMDTTIYGAESVVNIAYENSYTEQNREVNAIRNKAVSNLNKVEEKTKSKSKEEPINYPVASVAETRDLKLELENAILGGKEVLMQYIMQIQRELNELSQESFKEKIQQGSAAGICGVGLLLDGPLPFGDVIGCGAAGVVLGLGAIEVATRSGIIERLGATIQAAAEELAEMVREAKVVESAAEENSSNESVNDKNIPRPNEKNPKDKLPTKGEHPYRPPKEKGVKPEDIRKSPDGKGYLDEDGNIWQWNGGQNHWDVQHTNGKHSNVEIDGSIRHLKDNF